MGFPSFWKIVPIILALLLVFSLGAGCSREIGPEPSREAELPEWVELYYLLGEIMVEGKAVPLDIIRINTRSGNNSERVTAFFDRYQVPDEDRMVPIIFLADSYLAGFQAITVVLDARLKTPSRLNLLVELIPLR
ncbi:MAG: hypothetical protein LBC60_09450 [Spirochaetaceae bacterium]|jgi:hypothetical protein|nr:hypothetical protein [Spirochaetaceae bacterium]